MESVEGREAMRRVGTLGAAAFIGVRKSPGGGGPAIAPAMQGGPCLTRGFPGPRQASVADAIGDRFIWWPGGVPARQTVAIISSRLQPRQQVLAPWLRAFRSACRELDEASEMLVSAEKTCAWPFVRRAAVHKRMPLLQIHEPPPRLSWQTWFKQCSRPPDESGSFQLHAAFLSPPLQSVLEDLPLRDRYLVATADRVVVCHVRRGGHLESLVGAICKHSPQRVQVAVDGGLVAEELLQEWSDLGCRFLESDREQLEPKARRPFLTDLRPPDLIDPTQPPTIDTLVPLNTGEFLTHCTRRPPGPWPDQSCEEYIDELILEPGSADRTALDALVRIVSQRCLLASHAAIRGKTPAVCFTARHPLELRPLRTYRPHRCRWDFEPYGLCIRRRVLQQLGTQPSIYGDDTTWRSLAAAERPFFQRRFSNTRGRGRQIDWSVEQEWRHLGDLDLSQLQVADVVLFVPTIGEATYLSSISCWPVAVLEEAAP